MRPTPHSSRTGAPAHAATEGIWNELRRPKPDLRLVEEMAAAMPASTASDRLLNAAIRWMVGHERGETINEVPAEILSARHMFAAIVGSGRMEAAHAFLEACDARIGETWRFEEAQMLASAPVFPRASRLGDVPRQDLQVCNGSGRATFVLFSGSSHRLGCSLNTFDLFLQPLPANAVYLRDFGNMFYLRGIESFGDLESSVTQLKLRLDRMNASPVICVGNSGGGYGALLFGNALSADKVVCFSGRSTLQDLEDDPESRPIFSKVTATIAEQKIPVPDLIEAYRRSSIPVHWVFGAENRFDAHHAEAFATAGTATLEPIVGWKGHNVMGVLAAKGRLKAIFQGCL